MCTMNVIKWHVKQIKNSKYVQNSGIMVPGLHGNHEFHFYGQLVNIIRIPYMNGYSVFLFKGEWFDTDCKKRKRIVRDYHVMLMNTNNLQYKDDPYVLATQAQHVFYLDDPNLGFGWKVIQKIDIDMFGTFQIMRRRMSRKQTTMMRQTKKKLETWIELLKMRIWIQLDHYVETTLNLKSMFLAKDLVDLLDSFVNDDFIDDDPKEEETLFGDEEDTEDNDAYSDLD